jgi:predicted HTH transcriptional regulator
MKKTSTQAFIDSRENAQSNRNKLTKAITEHKQGTSRQLAKWSGVDYIETARRMSELVRNGICKGELNILCPFIKKGPVTLWQLTPKGNINDLNYF